MCDFIRTLKQDIDNIHKEVIRRLNQCENNCIITYTSFKYISSISLDFVVVVVYAYALYLQ